MDLSNALVLIHFETPLVPLPLQFTFHWQIKSNSNGFIRIFQNENAQSKQFFHAENIEFMPSKLNVS